MSQAFGQSRLNFPVKSLWYGKVEPTEFASPRFSAGNATTHHEFLIVRFIVIDGNVTS